VDPTLALPEIVYMLGFAIFIYTVGLSSGRAFLTSLRRDGVRHSALAVGASAAAALLVVAARRLLHLDLPTAAGLFAGSVTNTPALAAAIETLRQTAPAQALREPVVAYSICYPMGILGVVLALRLAARLWPVDPAEEARRLADRQLGGTNEPLSSETVQVAKDLGGFTIAELIRGLGWRVIFGRIRRDGTLRIAAPDERLLPGDLVTVVGTPTELARVAARLGAIAEERIDLDRSEFDIRRIFVSNAEVASRPLAELDLPRRFETVVTRVRRGDEHLLPTDDMRLDIGDRVRVLGPVRRLAEVTAFFGDSYRAASEVDILTFGLGLAFGLVLGILPIPLPGGVSVTLGFAGGPLVVALVLGSVSRTGGMIWALPFSANVALRQVGLVLFLAGIGTRAGQGFLAAFSGGAGLAILGAGAAITFVVAFGTLFAAHRLMRLPWSLATGMVAGVHTQTAVLGYALEQSRDEVPSIGFASMYPAATLAKLVLVQVLVAFG
jgi:putative transport protein